MRIAAETNDENEIEWLHTGLLKYSEYTGPFSGTNARRILGISAGMLGRLAESQEHFEAALEIVRNNGQRPENGYTAFDYSQMLLERNAPGDREKSTELQDEAIAIAQELGMNPLLERVLGSGRY